VIGSRQRRTASAVGRFWCRVAVLAIWAVLGGAVSVSTASAGLVEKTVDTVGATVKSVQDTANAVPPVPGTSPPATPPSPPATPGPPPQAVPKLPSKAPSQEPSPPSSRAGAAAPAPHVSDPPVDRVAGAAHSVVDSVASAGNKAAPRAASSDRSDAASSERSDEVPGGTARAALPDRVEGSASGAPVRERRRASPPVAVRPAKAAVLQRWLARVWPAIALGGAGDGVAGMIATGGLFHPALVAATAMLLASSPILPASGEAPLAGHPGVAGASKSAPDQAPAPAVAEGGSVLYMIVMAGLLALLAFTVWREFRVALHPGPR